jgi:hypothetical protein
MSEISIKINIVFNCQLQQIVARVLSSNNFILPMAALYIYIIYLCLQLYEEIGQFNMNEMGAVQCQQK